MARLFFCRFEFDTCKSVSIIPKSERERGLTAITPKYDGGFSADHKINMRQFGYSLLGVDRVISKGLITLSERRLPKRREHLPFQLVVKGPNRGSVEVFGALMTAYQAGQGSLP